MADESKPKRLRCRVVCHQYGRHFRGECIDVDEREYQRVGKRVLLSEEDEKAQRRAAEARRAQQDAQVGRDRSAANGWSDKEAEALRLVRQRFLDEQKRQRDVLVGDEPVDTSVPARK